MSFAEFMQVLLIKMEFLEQFCLAFKKKKNSP